MSYGDDYNGVVEAIVEATRPPALPSHLADERGFPTLQADVAVQEVEVTISIRFNNTLGPELQNWIVDRLNDKFSLDDVGWEGDTLEFEVTLGARGQAENTRKEVERAVVDAIDDLQVEGLI